MATRQDYELARARLNMGATYQVRGRLGIAWYLVGWAEDEVRPDPYLVCGPATNHNRIHTYHEHEDDCYAMSDDPDDYVRQSTTEVLGIMVGDDQRYRLDITDLIQLDSEDYCADCGQVGCSWGT